MQHHLSDLAQNEIRQLEADGIRLTAHDIVHIVALAEAACSPRRRLELSRGRPIAVGNVTLWPLTLYAAEWWSEAATAMRSDNDKVYALAYAMANGRSDLPTVNALDVVDQWRKGLRCRFSELREAISLVQAQDSMLDTGGNGPPASAGEISMMLTAMTGVRPEVWERQCAIKYVVEMLDTIVAQNTADGASTKSDPTVKGLRALGLAVERIRARHAQEQDNG